MSKPGKGRVAPNLDVSLDREEKGRIVLAARDAGTGAHFTVNLSREGAATLAGNLGLAALPDQEHDTWSFALAGHLDTDGVARRSPFATAERRSPLEG